MTGELIGLLLAIIILGVPLVCLALIIALIVWLARGPARTMARLDEFERLVKRWLANGQIEPATAERLHALIAAERGPAPRGARPPAAATVAAEPPAEPGGAPAADPVASPTLAPPATLGAAEPAPAPTIAERASRPALGAAVLALGTRRTLLYLGAFLIVMSALTLVVFNWASFSAFAQLAILAGTALALWAGGSWMTARPELATAGRNLQVVAALLVPVVGFALGRPGLLDLSLRQGWLLASALSLGLYVAAAVRSRGRFYSSAAAIAAQSSLLAALGVGGVELAWQMPWLVGLSAALVGLARLLERDSPRQAAGPRWIAHIGVGLALLAAASFGSLLLSDGWALASSLGAAAGFYLVCWGLDRRSSWMWPVAALAALAAEIVIGEARLGLSGRALSYAGLSGLYLGLCTMLVGRREAAQPFLLGSLLLGLLGLGAAQDLLAIRAAYPLLILVLVAALLLQRSGRLALTDRPSPALESGLLGGAGLLLAAWAGVSLHLAGLSAGSIGLLMVGAGGIYLAAARWWPGRLARHLDQTLQILGLLATLAAALLILGERSLWLPGAALLALLWLVQAADRRSAAWAGLGLGAGLATVLFAVERMEPVAAGTYGAAAAALCWIYVGAAHPLQRRGLRHWSLPGLLWGAVAGLLALFFAGVANLPTPEPLAVGVILSLGALLAWQSRPWGQALLGYPAALLIGAAVMLAGGQGFFTGWRPADHQLAIVAAGLALGLGGAGWLLRRRGAASFGLPYALAALLALALMPPLGLLGGPGFQSLSWALLGGLLLLGAAAYGQPWLVALAALSLDMALISGVVWRRPAAGALGLAWPLAGAVAAQTLAGLGLRRLPSQRLGQAGLALYLAAGLGATAALGLGLIAGDLRGLGLLALALAGLLALAATIERHPAPAWAGWLLGLIGAAALLLAAGMSLPWAAAWISLILVGLALAGWLLARLGQAIWAGPSGPGGAIAAAAASALCLVGGEPAALTFALASAGLLLATLAVRERQIAYAYVAGAALVGATMSQLADWGLSNPQWYVIPAGLYLLALAEGLRRFQQRRRVSQLIEAAAAVLLLGTTMGQALNGGGPLLGLLLCGEAMLVGGYGALLRLRAPFVAGLSFFVAAVLWMFVDTVRLANQWLLLGIAGALMVGAYVLLERHQERMLRAGRAWADRLRSWG